MCTDIVSDIHEKQILYNISCPSVLWFQLPFRMVPPAGIEGLNITGAQRWNSMQKSATETSSRIKEPSALVCWSVGCVHAQYPFCGKSEVLSAAAALSAFNWTFCMCASSTVIFYTQVVVVQANARIAVKTLSFGTANAQARSVWTRGMKIHLGSSKFSGKVASIKLQFLRYRFRPTPCACLKRFLPCLKRIITYKRRKRRLQYWRYLPCHFHFQHSLHLRPIVTCIPCCCRPPKMIIVPQTIQISMNLGRQTTLYRQYQTHWTWIFWLCAGISRGIVSG